MNVKCRAIRVSLAIRLVQQYKSSTKSQGESHNPVQQQNKRISSYFQILKEKYLQPQPREKAPVFGSTGFRLLKLSSVGLGKF